MAELRIAFEVGFSRRTARWALAALMLGAAVSELDSESLTLTSYYPSPLGIYTDLTTTGQTFLARDGGQVGIGTAGTASALHIAAASAAASPLGTAAGQITVDNTTPGNGSHSSLDFRGNQGRPIARLSMLQTSNGSILKLGTSNSYVSGITNTALAIGPTGLVGIGSPSPAHGLDVVGDVHSTLDICTDQPAGNPQCLSTVSVDKAKLAAFRIFFTRLNGASSGEGACQAYGSNVHCMSAGYGADSYAFCTTGIASQDVPANQSAGAQCIVLPQ